MKNKNKLTINVQKHCKTTEKRITFTYIKGGIKRVAKRIRI